jgi:hypothetical protein
MDFLKFAAENARREFAGKKTPAIDRQQIPDLTKMLNAQPPHTEREELELLYGKEYADYLLGEIDPRD